MRAILSGIEGNIAAYEAVLADILRQHVEAEALATIARTLFEPAESTMQLSNTILLIPTTVG